MLIALVTACSEGEKEYIYKECNTYDQTDSCDDTCWKTGIISFKTSESLDSVMKTVISNYKKESSTIDNCKIFDDETFECKTLDMTYRDNIYSYKIILSNGKFSEKETGGFIRLSEDSHITISKRNSFKCGIKVTTIKRISDFLGFKKTP